MMLVSDINPIFISAQYKVCPMLEININLTLNSDINMIFIFVGFGLLNANFVLEQMDKSS